MIAALLLQFWKPLAAIALAATIGLGIYVKGYSDASAKCHDAELRAEIASLQRDLSIAREATAEAEATARDLAAETQRLEKENADAESQRTAAPECRYSPSDLDWLRRHGR